MTSLFKQKAPTLGGAGGTCNWLPSALGKVFTSPSAPQPTSQNLKNQLFQYATCEPCSTFISRLYWIFLWLPGMLGRTELKASFQAYTPDTKLPASSQPPAQETGKEQCLCTQRAGKAKVGIYLPSPSTAAVVFCSTPFLETQQTAAKTVEGQRSRKGKMLLQNMQRLSYRL